VKIKANVVSVADNGDVLAIVAQGAEISAARYERLTPIEFRVRNIAVNRQTFRVGRALLITVEAK
jgi:hypothetical protein